MAPVICNLDTLGNYYEWFRINLFIWRFVHIKYLHTMLFSIFQYCEKYIVHLNIQYELHNYQFRSPLISVTYDFKSLCINYCMMFPLKKFTGIVLGGEKMPYSLTVSINSGNYFSSLRLLITTYLFLYL